MTEPSPIPGEAVLVAIPTFNEAKHIEATLRAILDQGGPEMRQATVVVADGQSTDGTQEIVKRIARDWPGLYLLDNPERFQAQGVNAAVRAHRLPAHRYLVRVDAHAHYPPRYVMQVVERMADTGADAVATVMDSVGDTCFQRGLAAALATKLGSGGSPHRGGQRSGWVEHGHHAGFRIDRFADLGGYDTSFVTNQDAEFDARLTAAGGRVWLEASIRMGYIVRATPKALWRQYWKYGRGRLRTTLRHRLALRPRQMIPVVLALLVVLAGLVAPVAPWALWLPGAYLALMLGVGAGLAASARDLCTLWAGPALVIMHLAWGMGFLWQFIRQKGRDA